MKNPNKPIPITVAAKGKKMIQLALKHADRWESSYLSPEEFAFTNSKFEEAYKESKLTKKIIESIELDVIIANSDSELKYKKRLFAMERGPAILNKIQRHSLVGKPEDIEQKIRKYIDVGVEQFFLAFQDPFDYQATNCHKHYETKQITIKLYVE
jgi:alkanesulfonate monooxygenase SsuD/methylene tetrahydromethanopterin reductase-like flavin-dependent oxidoreductase (luciferase family)